MKLFILLLLFLFITSCSTTRVVRTENNQGGETQVQIEIPVEIDEVVIVEDKKDFLKVNKFNGFTKAEIDRFWKYADSVKRTLETTCFYNYMANRKLVQTNNLTPKQIVDKLRGEKPVLNFTMYYKWNRTVGYTYPNSDTIWFNRKFHKNFSHKSSGANLAHEVSHKLGFGHDFKRTTRRPFSVPYSVGSGVKLCWLE